ncbi:MAG: sodium-extruding oxaloacetate decarboxylase subunit alpha [Chloroflexi bacterium]|nr:sodium-extruding oxaloacetate decarboxylase subunit alpha [Chloroflexota bacterium]
MSRIRLVETALRDGHQSLLATRMRTRDMLPVLERLDLVGYYSLEVWGGATFDSCIRFLNEDPWERLREIRKHITHTPLQMLLRGQNLVGYRHYADDIVERFICRAVENGIDIFRVFDALNDLRNMELSIKIIKREGVHAQGTICYTVSPVHSVERFAEMAKHFDELGCDSICIKDMAGLISPHSARDLIRAIKKVTCLPVDLHCHCTSGVAPMSYFAACAAGVSVLDTAISPFSGGSSQPPTESIVAALQDTAFDTGLNLELLFEIKRYFESLRDKYGSLLDPIAERTDAGVFTHQIPGGMLSNLVSQLKQQNALDKYDEVIRELPRVRAEMGYPPLVTPTSQIVGTQAVFNVLSGERYKMVSREVKDYFKGLYGRPPAPFDNNIKKMVIGDEEPITTRPADSIPPQLAILRAEATELGIMRSEEDLLTYALYPDIAVRFLRGESKEEEIKPARVESKPPVVEAPVSARLFEVDVDGEVYRVKVTPAGEAEIANRLEGAPKRPNGRIKGGVVSPMQGVIIKLKGHLGQWVHKGDLLAILEAMKMQNNIVAQEAGVISEIFVAEGETVIANDVLMVIGPDERKATPS